MSGVRSYGDPAVVAGATVVVGAGGGCVVVGVVGGGGADVVTGGRVVVGRVVVVEGVTVIRGGTVGCGSGDPVMVDPLSCANKPESSVIGVSTTTSCTNDGASPPARNTLVPIVVTAASEIGRGSVPANRNVGGVAAG